MKNQDYILLYSDYIKYTRTSICAIIDKILSWKANYKSFKVTASTQANFPLNYFNTKLSE